MTLIRMVLDIFLLFVLGGVRFARYKGVQVGTGCQFYTRNWGSEPFLITIGNRVTLTSGVKLLTHDGSTRLVRDSENYRFQRYAPISIGDDVFVGVNAIVLPGVTIGSKVVVGAGAVVTTDIPDNSIAVGNPARVIGLFTDLERKISQTCVSDRDLKGAKSYEDRVRKAMALANKK